MLNEGKSPCLTWRSQKAGAIWIIRASVGRDVYGSDLSSTNGHLRFSTDADAARAGAQSGACCGPGAGGGGAGRTDYLSARTLSLPVFLPDGRYGPFSFGRTH